MLAQLQETHAEETATASASAGRALQAAQQQVTACRGEAEAINLQLAASQSACQQLRHGFQALQITAAAKDGDCVKLARQLTLCRQELADSQRSASQENAQHRRVCETQVQIHLGELAALQREHEAAMAVQHAKHSAAMVQLTRASGNEQNALHEDLAQQLQRSAEKISGLQKEFAAQELQQEIALAQKSRELEISSSKVAGLQAQLVEVEHSAASAAESLAKLTSHVKEVQQQADETAETMAAQAAADKRALAEAQGTAEGLRRQLWEAQEHGRQELAALKSQATDDAMQAIARLQLSRQFSCISHIVWPFSCPLSCLHITRKPF